MKAFVKVWFKSEGGRSTPVVGKGYSPHIIVHGGNGELLGVTFTDDLTYEFGKPHFCEIVSLFTDLVDYAEVKKDAKFSVVEGLLVVAEGRVLAIAEEPA